METTEQQATTLVTVTADKIETRLVRWLWRGYIAEKLNTVSGDPGEGKGLFTCYLAARVSTGTDFFECKNEHPPSEVLMMSNEDDVDDTLVPRLQAARADLSKVHILQMVSVDCGKGETRKEREFQLDQDVKRLEEFLANQSEIRLVIVDPVSNYLGESTKMIDEKSVRRALMPLKKLAEKMHVAVVAVMHLNKKSDQKHMYRISGAMGFVGVARMNWMCIKTPPNDNGELNDDFELQKVKGNIVKRDKKGLVYRIEDAIIEIEGKLATIPYTKFVGYAEKTLDQQGQQQNDRPAHRPAKKTPACEQRLVELLSNGPMPWDVLIDTMDEDGFSESTAKRAAFALNVVKYDGDQRETRRDGKQYPVKMCRLPDPVPAKKVVQIDTRSELLF